MFDVAVPLYVLVSAAADIVSVAWPITNEPLFIVTL